MSTAAIRITPIQSVVRALTRYWYLWMGTTMVCTGAAAAYAVMSPKSWEATQSIVIRDELDGDKVRLGRFESLDAMKTAQETIAEIARNPSVLRKAMEKVGEPALRVQTEGPIEPWPTLKEVETMRDSVAIVAPNGAEFGKTEVLHLNVSASSPEYATKFVAALIDDVEARLKELRALKAQGIEDELKQAVELAHNALEISANELEVIEATVGNDLGELRILNEPTAGDSGIRRALAQVELELREAKQIHRANELQSQHLKRLAEDPDGIVSTPNSVLMVHSALRRLKDGLIDAHLAQARIEGMYQSSHPRAIAARSSSVSIRQRLHQEIATTIHGAQTDLTISEERVRQLEQSAAGLSDRLEILVALRVPYSRALDRVSQQRDILSEAERDLAKVQASRNAAMLASVIARIDGPQVGSQPSGPGKKVVIAGGLLAGLVTGLGLVLFASAPTSDATNVVRSSTRVTAAQPAPRSEQDIQIRDQRQEKTEDPLCELELSAGLADEVAQIRHEVKRQRELSNTKIDVS